MLVPVTVAQDVPVDNIDMVVGNVIFNLPALVIGSKRVTRKVYVVFALTVDESRVGVVEVIEDGDAENVAVPWSLGKLNL